MNSFQKIASTHFSLFTFEKKSQIKLTFLNEDHDGIPIVLAPGFLTEGSEDWLKYVQSKIDAPIIYVQWRSSSILKVSTKVLFGMLGNIIFKSTGGLMLVGIISIVRRLKIHNFFSGAYSSWASAAKEANSAGLELANILNDKWNNNDKAVFIGHSLGVRVITNAMINLKHDNILTSISVAGAINQEEFNARITNIESPRKINHSNLYSTNDRVLKWLYRIGELNVKKLPIGLSQSRLDNVTDYRNDIGHTKYHNENEYFDRLIVKLYKNAVDSLLIDEKEINNNF